MVANDLSEAYGINSKDVRIFHGASRFETTFDFRDPQPPYKIGLIGGNFNQKGIPFCNNMLNELFKRGLPFSYINIGVMKK